MISAASSKALARSDERVSVLETLVATAALAPSGDNTQPWQFHIDEESLRIRIAVDESRDPSPMNAGQRMSRIAVGAALENLVRTAVDNDLGCEVEFSGGNAVVAHLSSLGLQPLQTDPTLKSRCTNRSVYDGKAVARDVVQRLEQLRPDSERVGVLWITDRPRIDRLAAIVQNSDALMFGDSALRRSIFSSVRFDRPAGESVAEGLSLASLELRGFDRHAFRLLPTIGKRVGQWIRLGALIGAKSKKLVRSASGLCIGVVADDEWHTDYLVGRAMQQMWLELTRQRFAVQPMMSLPVLENVVSNSAAGVHTLDGKRVKRIREDLRQLLPRIGNRRPAFILRFGYSRAPTGRVGRRPLTDVTSIQAGSK
jgi:hypothetical protein